MAVCGWSALGRSDAARAEGCFRELIVLTDQVGSLRRTADAAAGLGALIAQHEEERAQLLGAASAVFTKLELGFYGELEQRLHDEAVSAARAAPGDEPFAAAFAGETVAPEEIVEFARVPT